MFSKILEFCTCDLNINKVESNTSIFIYYIIIEVKVLTESFIFCSVWLVLEKYTLKNFAIESKFLTIINKELSAKQLYAGKKFYRFSFDEKKSCTHQIMMSSTRKMVNFN